MTNVKHIRHNNLGADKVLITHTDLDGVGCAVVFLKCYPNGHVFFADYDHVNELTLEITTQFSNADILISDLSVDASVAMRLNERGKVGLLDHHKTAEWLNQYEWATVEQGKCGTRLVFDMLSAWFNIQDLEEFVNTVEDWDLWGNGTYPGQEAIQYEFLFRFMGKRDFMFEAMKNPAFPLDPQWSWLLDKLMKQYEEYYEVTRYITQVHTNGEYKVGITIADRYASLMGHRLCEDLDLEYVMLINNRQGKASLRGRGNIDLGELAKQAGGGGHRKAAGFRLGEQAVGIVRDIEGNAP